MCIHVLPFGEQRLQLYLRDHADSSEAVSAVVRVGVCGHPCCLRPAMSLLPCLRPTLKIYLARTRCLGLETFDNRSCITRTRDDAVF